MATLRCAWHHDAVVMTEFRITGASKATAFLTFFPSESLDDFMATLRELYNKEATSTDLKSAQRWYRRQVRQLAWRYALERLNNLMRAANR